MFSKLKRSKSSVESPIIREDQLRGMPALKQKRASRRSGKLSMDPLSPQETKSPNHLVASDQCSDVQRIQNRRSLPGELEALDHRHNGGKRHIRLRSRGNPANKKVEAVKMSPYYDQANGRALHLLKKQRQAKRESSMSDLTPKERESILCLEEVLNDVSAHDDEALTRPRENGDDVFDSSPSSIGSVIDLVGELSTDCGTPPSAP